MKHVFYYPKGHDRAGEIYAIFHEFKKRGQEDADPPPQTGDNGESLERYRAADDEIPDPPDVDFESLKIDPDVPEVVER